MMNLDLININKESFTKLGEDFTKEQVFCEYDPVTNLFFASVPKYNLTTCNEDKQEALKQLASNYIKLKSNNLKVIDNN